MLVETYEVDETTEDDTELEALKADNESLHLIDKLGLDGQTALVCKDETTGLKTRIPYQEMSSEELRVYECLFPQKTLVTEYRHGIIPLRVLQVIAHAKEMFEEVYVYHKKMVDPDPVLVGMVAKEDGETKQRLFLLARWGSALDNFQILLKQAQEKLKVKWLRDLAKKKQECEAFAGAIDAKIDEWFEGDYVFLP